MASLLADAAAPFGDGAKTPAQHLRNIFGRMGLNDKDIVALSGAHTLGRSRPDRSGEPFEWMLHGGGLAHLDSRGGAGKVATA